MGQCPFGPEALEGAHKLQGRGRGNLPSPHVPKLHQSGEQGCHSGFTSNLDFRGGMTSAVMWLSHSQNWLHNK